MRFAAMGLRARIYSGFGLLVALGLAMAGFGYYGLSNVGAEVGKMDALAGNVSRVQEASLMLEVIRRAGTRYRIDAPESSAKDIETAEARTTVLLVELAANTQSEQRRKLYNSVGDTLRTLVAKDAEFVKLVKAGYQDRTKLLAAGENLNAAIAHLFEQASALGDPEKLPLADKVESAILLVRVASLRFLATVDPAGIATVTTNARKANDALTAFDRSAGADLKKSAETVRVALASYVASFEGASSNLLKGFAVYEEGVRPAILSMQGEIAKAEASLKEAYSQNSAEAAAETSHTSWMQAAMSIAGALLGALLAALIGRGIVRPVASMTQAMTRLAEGDHDIDIPARENKDEIGAMARAVEVFKQNAIENKRLTEEQAKERAARDRRQAAMDRHTEDFGSSVSGVMASLVQSAGDMRAAATTMSNAAKTTRGSTSNTVDGATSSSRDLNSVAAAAEQMAASINEISKQVAHVTQAVRNAVTSAEATDAKVAGLAETADRIGDVVRLINDIAGQTNLLALNATIEAARAGDAGKGFAVVAGEVKVLAAQTAKATDQIGAQIVAIRAATQEAVTAVRDVGSAIGQVESVATAIAAAVEEQAAATREITASVQTVSATTSAAAQSMQEVLTIAEGAEATSQTVLSAADELGKTADTLRTEVTDFLSAMSRGDDAERRRYERCPGNGTKATLRIAGQPEVQAEIVDISRGGAAVRYQGQVAAGVDATMILPGHGPAVTCRVARAGTGTLSLTFRQDAATMIRVDQAMDVIAKAAVRRAA
jgi:methyl-accepting chemotaxis protein